MTKFQIINSRTGEVVGRASTIKSARRVADRRDNEYGAYIHRIVATETGRQEL